MFKKQHTLKSQSGDDPCLSILCHATQSRSFSLLSTNVFISAHLSNLHDLITLLFSVPFHLT